MAVGGRDKSLQWCSGDQVGVLRAADFAFGRGPPWICGA